MPGTEDVHHAAGEDRFREPASGSVDTRLLRGDGVHDFPGPGEVCRGWFHAESG